MTRLVFIEPNGIERNVVAEDGLSLMVAAVENNINGIEAICGGHCNCGTCHVRFDKNIFGRLEAPYLGEKQILEQLTNADHFSRLACQVKVTPGLDQVIVRVIGPDVNE